MGRTSPGSGISPPGTSPPSLSPPSSRGSPLAPTVPPPLLPYLLLLREFQLRVFPRKNFSSSSAAAADVTSDSGDGELCELELGIPVEELAEFCGIELNWGRKLT